jgi:hypothetical protein
MNAFFKDLRNLSCVLIMVGYTCGFSSMVSAELEFVTQPIGYPVHYFEPVDIEGDGIWELALQVGKNGDSVGVYSPLQHRWIDGPHYLLVEGNNWGCGGLDNEVGITYFYLVDNLIRQFNPTNTIDSIIYSSGFAPHAMVVLGFNSAQGPSAFLGQYHYEKTGGQSCDEYGMECFYHYEGQMDYSWSQFSLATGQYQNLFGGWLSKPVTHFTNREGSTPFLCVYTYSESFTYSTGMYCPSIHISNSINLLDIDIQESMNHKLPQPPDFYNCPFPSEMFCHQIRLKFATLSSDLADNVAVYWAVSGYRLCWGQQLWRIGSGNTWFMDLDHAIAGMTYFDWYGDSSGVLFMPTTNRNLWEIRDPQTGALIDSILGLPPADIRTAPIMEADKLDLYYFLDSTLYILERPGMSTDVLAEDEETGIPATFTLRQNYPNPFNASTVIEFELADPGSVKLEIYNILGKKVAVLLDEYRPAGRHRVSWEGTGPDGTELVSGIYFARLAVAGSMQTRKMTLLK